MDIFDTNALMISELIEARLPGTACSAPDLAEVFSWFAYDRDVEFRNRHLLPGHLVRLRDQLDDLQRDIFQAERRYELMITTGYNAYFYGVARAWCRGATMADLLQQGGPQRGRHRHDVQQDARPDAPGARDAAAARTRTTRCCPTLREADGLLRRGVVEMVYSLGFVRSARSRPSRAPPGRSSSRNRPNPPAAGSPTWIACWGILADPNSTPPVIHPPDTALQRPDRPARFPPRAGRRTGAPAPAPHGQSRRRARPQRAPPGIRRPGAGRAPALHRRHAPQAPHPPWPRYAPRWAPAPRRRLAMDIWAALATLDALGLPRDSYAVFGSGPLGARGLRESGDLDIIVSPALWTELAQRYPVRHKAEGAAVVIGDIEVWDRWHSGGWAGSRPDPRSREIRSYRFVRLDKVLAWKEAVGRPKDRADAALIRRYLAEHADAPGDTPA